MVKNTLVCENLDVATEVGYGRNRMRCVTLNGEVIETSGAMTGGGRPKQGLMGNRIKTNNNGKTI